MLAPARAFEDPSQKIAAVNVSGDPPVLAHELSRQDEALVQLGQDLLAQGYRFTTITPASHNVVRARPPKRPPTLRDIFGWSLPFTAADLPGSLLTRLGTAGALADGIGGLRSAVRFSTLGEQIFVHSAFPTAQADAVFFGPDTYRFARALRHSIATWVPRPVIRILDVGAGSGAGGLYAASLLRHAKTRVTLTDINRGALRFSAINAALNRVPDVAVIESDLYDGIDGAFDLIVANPPYLVDPLARLYRHGGGELGAALSIRIAAEGIARLAPGGRLLLYTGSAIVDGVDALHAALRARLADRAVRFAYEEIDPDVFGEELGHPPYDRVERIAVVVATIDAGAGSGQVGSVS
jgi:methylase of polypeptide subunit release factors